MIATKQSKRCRCLGIAGRSNDRQILGQNCCRAFGSSRFSGSKEPVFQNVTNPVPAEGGTGIEQWTASRARSKRNLEVAASVLFDLEGFKEGLEVALTEALAAAATDDLEEKGRAVLQRLGEQLE
jgi:hypothetical protein